MKNIDHGHLVHLVLAGLLMLPLAMTLTGSPSTVEAKAGACANHGGVSCEAGADKDGSVICKDGYKRSVVQYDSMEMCKNTHPSATQQTQQTTGHVQTHEANPSSTTCREGFHFSTAKHRCVRGQ